MVSFWGCRVLNPQGTWFVFLYMIPLLKKLTMSSKVIESKKCT
jgi:hypothetical protein